MMTTLSSEEEKIVQMFRKADRHKRETIKTSYDKFIEWLKETLYDVFVRLAGSALNVIWEGMKSTFS